VNAQWRWQLQEAGGAGTGQPTPLALNFFVIADRYKDDIA
jgi:hypothetical protein